MRVTQVWKNLYFCTAFRRQTIPPIGGFMQNTHNQKALLGGGRFSRLAGDCSGFLTLGCKQVPPEYTHGIIRWAHPDGYFLNAQGQKMADHLTPSHIKHCNSHPAPNLSNGGISCHRAMALAHYGPCPVFTDPKTGRKYKGHCHHLIPDLRDYRPANLLCWLTREQHAEADRRQRALSKRVPDLHAFTYERLRELQDPRTMSREEFEKQLALIPVFVVDPDCDRREPYKHC